MITLYDYWRSSASYRVRIALNLLGLPYQIHPVDLLAGDQRGERNLARNPQGLVPTLEIDGQTLTQSLAIIEYLDETHRPLLLPKDPPGRARVRTLSYAIAMEIAPVCNLSVRRHAAKISHGDITADDWQRLYITNGFAAVEAMLSHPQTGRYCHGDQITMADLCLVPQVYNAERAEVDLAAFPRLTLINEALKAVPAIAAAHPDRANPVV